MRLGIRSAISALVLTSIVVSAVGVHLLWWRTAQQVSQTLADTINDQIVSAVGDELQSVTTRSAIVHDGGAHAAGRKSIRAARRHEARSRIPVAAVVSADHFLGGVRMAGWVVLRRAQARRRRHRNARDHPRPQDANQPLRIRRQRPSAQEHAGRGHQLFRHRSGMVSGGHRDQRRTLGDADDASERRAAGGRLRGSDQYRPKARRRHRHHHRTDARLEFPVAAHRRKVSRRVHPRAGRKGRRRTRSERQRGDGAENRSSAVSRRGGCDPERQRLQSR